ncbi:MAG: hypothetical protein ACMG6E_01255 [Candidatus Roizmanbacteria bacterium]
MDPIPEYLTLAAFSLQKAQQMRESAIRLILTNLIDPNKYIISDNDDANEADEHNFYIISEMPKNDDIDTDAILLIKFTNYQLHLSPAFENQFPRLVINLNQVFNRTSELRNYMRQILK